LIIGVVAVALLGLLWMQFTQKQVNHGRVVVTVDNEVYGEYALDQDRTERIEFKDGSYNVLEIRDGEADMTEASCPDQICVEHQKINKTNQTIVCLPNKVIVTIEEGEETEVDSVSS
jgi:hypothetical protein